MSIKIYPDMTHLRTNDKKYIKSAKKHGVKLKPGVELFKRYLSELDSIEHAYSLARLADEHLWYSLGKNVIFPNDDLLNAAWKAKFDLGRLEDASRIIRTPMKSFVLAMPSHILFDGDELPSPMVTFQRYDFEDRKSAIDGFTEHYSLNTQLQINPNDPAFGENILYIQYQSMKNKELYLCLHTPESEIPRILSSRNVDEYTATIQEMSRGNTVVSGIDLSQDKDEARIQFKLIKLVVSLMVFYCVRPDSISEGLTNYKSSSKPKYSSSPASYGKLVLGGGKYENKFGNKNVMHLRRLSHERYYTKEEHANKERGTRWIVCGADKAPHTQELPED